MSDQNYVLVMKKEEKEEEKQEILELPTEEDGTLLLSTLCNHFPKASGLSYRKLKRVENSNKGLLIKEKVHLENGKLYPPSESGWSSYIFSCVLEDKLTPRKIENAKRKSLSLKLNEKIFQKKNKDVPAQSGQIDCEGQNNCESKEDRKDKAETNLKHTSPTQDETYKVLPGALNLGEKYETIFVANLALNLALNEDIKEFFISVNNAAFYPFDDVTLETEMMDGCQQKLALQLKHGERLLTIQSLTGKSGDFSIQKYMEGVSKMKKSSYQHQQLDNFKWILFTNRKCNFDENGVRFKSENGNFDIQMLRCEAENILKICSKNGTCYKFQVEDASTEVGQFFENFFLYVGQLNVVQMENELSERFQKVFGCDKIIFMQYLNFITEWNNTKGKRKKLNKLWIKQLIAMILLSPLIQPLSKTSVSDDKSNILRKCIDTFNITTFSKGCIKKISQFWDIEKEFKTVDINIVNELKDKFQLNSDDMTDIVYSKLLWLLERCPLIIRYTENITKAVTLCENKRFIIICDGPFNEKIRSCLKNVSIFQNLSDLKKHASYYKELTKTFSCSLQGKQQITLKTLTNESEEFLKYITTDDLLLFLNDNLVIGEETDNVNIYIPRSFSRQIIEEEFLQTCSKDIVIVIDCFEETSTLSNYFEIKHVEAILNSALDPKIFLNERKNVKKIIYVSKNRCNPKQLMALREKLGDDASKNLHHFRWFKGKLEWIFSLTRIADLRSFINDKEYFTNEEELYDNKCDDNLIVIFCGDAGLGKTTLMQNLSKNTFSSLWTLLLYPKDHTKHLKEMKGNICKFQKYVLAEARNKYRDFDLKILEMLLKTGRVNYIWDGLDEVSEESLHAVLDTIEALSKMRLKQFLTSRNNLREDLENRFSVLARTIKEFDENEQKYYIRKRLNCKEAELEELFRKISKQINFFKFKEILSVPLQIYMFTELLLQDEEKYNSLLNNLFSLTDLYEHFIEEKFNIYFRQKEKVNCSNDFLIGRIEDYKEKRMNQYQLMALKVYFSDQVFKTNIDCNSFVTEVKIKDVIGIITSVSSENVVNFLHNSYGEYFAALYFSKNYKKIKYLRFLFEEKNKNIRFMFDLMLAKGCPAHIAALCQNLDLLKSYDNDMLTKMDQGGRNALHLVCSWGKSYFPLKVDKSARRKCFKKKILYHIYPGQLLQKEESKNENMLRYLLQFFDFKQEDQVYKLNALSYADETYNLTALSALLENYVGSVKNFKCFKNIPSLLCYSAAYDLSTIFDHVKTIPHINIIRWSSYTDDTILSLAATNGSLSSCRKILSKSNKNNFDLDDSFVKAYIGGHVDVADLLVEAGADVNIIHRFGEFPLIVACDKGSVKLATLLIKAGDDVNFVDNYGRTPLLVACQKGFIDIANRLIKAGADINKSSPLIETCEKGFVDLVTLLIEASADVNIADRYGRTPLIIACQTGRIDIADCLIKAGVDVNTPDISGAFPLIVACETGFVDLVSFLIEVGADVNIADRYGITPLMASCERGHVDVVKLLIKAGADINTLNEYGVTPLILAYKNRLVSVANLLIEAGADINLTVACQEGLVEIANSLIKAGADVNIVNEVGTSPLMLACKKKCVDVACSLIEANADVNFTDKHGRTPLTIACRHGLVDVAVLLVKAGADVNAVDRTCRSFLLMSACKKGLVDLVILLTKTDVDVNITDTYYISTPLMVACENGFVDVVDCLIKAGADVNIVDRDGTTPLKAASRNGHVDVVNLLIKEGVDINQDSTNNII